ncbi:MAG: hypothetical protein Q8L10_00395 [Candidatus Moranbacteria bacterium]|nr:hypothetical protein [Candidatus Moranbacteria bacterium]
MNKYLTFALLSLAAVSLSGCSSAPAKPAEEAQPVAVKSSSVLKSVDGGRSWEFKGKVGDAVNLDAVDVLSMAINPYDTRNILVGTLKGGILKTDDAGENWSLLPFEAEKVYGLAVDPADSRIIYASGVWQDRGKIFKSIDGGNEWNEIYTAPSNGPLVISLVLDKKNPSVLYATTSDNQVVKSVDAGVSWKNIYASGSPVLKIAIDSADSNLLYLNLLSGVILRSRDGGSSIGEIEDEAVNQGIGVIEVDPLNANWVYAAGQAGIFRSKDAGTSWEMVKPLGDANAFPVKVLAINPANPREIAYGAAQATYKSLDGGVSWIPFQLQTEKSISIMKYSAEPDVLYLGLRKK